MRFLRALVLLRSKNKFEFNVQAGNSVRLYSYKGRCTLWIGFRYGIR